MAISFTALAGLALILGKISGHRKKAIEERSIEGVDTTPWRYFKPVAITATCAMIATYILLSPWGIVESSREKTIELGIIAAGIVMIFVLLGLPLILKKRQTE
jgi:uncharacterized sodium:solute symporter family permease YidK